MGLGLLNKIEERINKVENQREANRQDKKEQQASVRAGQHPSYRERIAQHIPERAEHIV